MAEIDQSGGGGGKKGRKKVSTKVDMTPMVDLAFLLITFFMLTTTFSKPKAMELNMPDKTEDNKQMPTKESLTLTVILGPEDRVFYYQGIENPTLEETTYSTSESNRGLRDMLLAKKRQIGPKMVVIIKAMPTSNYRNMVDIFDEMGITQIPTYALVEMTPQDFELVQKQKGV